LRGRDPYIHLVGCSERGALVGGPEVGEIARRVAVQLASIVISIQANLRRYVVVITNPNAPRKRFIELR
jgi:hypothetical protein